MLNFVAFPQELAFFFGIFFMGMVLINGTGIIYSWRKAKEIRESLGAASSEDAGSSMVSVVKQLDEDASSSLSSSGDAEFQSTQKLSSSGDDATEF